MRRIKDNLIVDLYSDIQSLKEFLESLPGSRNFYVHEIRDFYIGQLNALLKQQVAKYLYDDLVKDTGILNGIADTLYEDIRNANITLLNNLGVWWEKEVEITAGICEYGIFIKTYQSTLDPETELLQQLQTAMDNGDYIPKRIRALL